MAQVLLIRHGQASFGAADYDQLSTRGEAQARHLGVVMAARGEQPAQLFSGPMRRHRQTADALLAGAGWQQPIGTLPLFAEFDHQEVIQRFEPRYAEHVALMADLAAQPHPGEAFAQMFRQAIERWTHGAHDADYCESWPAFQQRAHDALNAAFALAGPKETVAVVTSGGVISVIAQALLGLDNRATQQINWTLANAGVSIVRQTSEGQRLLTSLNDYGHFRGEQDALLSFR